MLPTPITQPITDVLTVDSAALVTWFTFSVSNVFAKKSIKGCSNINVTKLPINANDIL